VALIFWRGERSRTGGSADPGSGPDPKPVEPDQGSPGPDDSTVALQPNDGTSTEDASGATAPLATAESLDNTHVYPPPPVHVDGRRRFPVGWITLGAILAAAAVAALLDVLGAVNVSAEDFLLVALGLTGVGVVAGALVGRVRGPLALGAATGLALIGVSIVDVPVHGGVGERTIRPAASSELDSEYRLGAGELVLDLRSVDLAAGDRTVEASVAVGNLVVLVPAGVEVVAQGSASVGQVDLFGHEEGGVRVETSAVAVPPTAAFVPDPGRLTLDLAVGVGRVETRIGDSL
jgi:hypothetical protein